MTVGEFLAEATERLEAAGGGSARLDVLVLLEDALGQDRALLLAHPERQIEAATEVKLNTEIVQRASHRPLAYIRGHHSFYGRDFLVDARVLVPRPETEAMIDLLKATSFSAQRPSLHFIDVGCGSGCVGITAALEIPGAQVELRDIDPRALEVAVSNAQRHGARVGLGRHDLLEDLPSAPIDALLVNLPYVPQDHPVPQAVRREPPQAIFSGRDGLDHYRRLWRQVKSLDPAQCPAYIFTESLLFQHADLTKLATEAGYHLSGEQSLIQRFQQKN